MIDKVGHQFAHRASNLLQMFRYSHLERHRSSISRVYLILAGTHHKYELIIHLFPIQDGYSALLFEAVMDHEDIINTLRSRGADRNHRAHVRSRILD